RLSPLSLHDALPIYIYPDVRIDEPHRHSQSRRSASRRSLRAYSTLSPMSVRSSHMPTKPDTVSASISSLPVRGLPSSGSAEGTGDRKSTRLNSSHSQ